MTDVVRPWTLVSVLLTADPQETHMARQRDIRSELADGVTAIRGPRPADPGSGAVPPPARRHGAEPVYEFSPELDRARRGAR
jgi:hypothetical protein